jgi:hypothetical protein
MFFDGNQMNVKTCLLITDDPDDHQAFTEAIAKLSELITVLIVVDSEKALTLVSSGKHIPDYVLIDLSIISSDTDNFIRDLRSALRSATVPVLLYGQPLQFAELSPQRFLTFLPKEYEYSKLQSVLRDFILGPGGN